MKTMTMTMMTMMTMITTEKKAHLFYFYTYSISLMELITDTQIHESSSGKSQPIFVRNL